MMPMVTESEKQIKTSSELTVRDLQPKPSDGQAISADISGQGEGGRHSPPLFKS